MLTDERLAEIKRDELRISKVSVKAAVELIAEIDRLTTKADAEGGEVVRLKTENKQRELEIRQLEEFIDSRIKPLKAELAEAREWISVDVRLPEPHGDVLARYENGDLFNGQICYGLHKPFWCDNSRDDKSDTIADRKVTHWMVIPKLNSHQTEQDKEG